MMNNKKIYIGTLVLMCGSIIYLFWENNSVCRELEKTQQAAEINSIKIKDYQKNQLYNWMISLDSLKDISITDNNKNTHQLFDLIDDETIIFYVHNLMCMMCVQKEIENLSKIAGVMGKENILVLAKGFSSKYLRKSDKFKKWRDNLYQTKSTPTLNNNNISGTPNVILVNNDYNILISYHALKHNTNDNFELFLHALKQKYDNS